MPGSPPRIEEAGRSPWHAVALSLVGAGTWLSGDDEGAVEPFQEAILASEGLPGGADLAALGGLSLLAADHGEWEEAREYAEEAVRRTAPYEAGDYLPNSAARMARDRLMAREGDDDAIADLMDMLGSLDPGFCPWIPPSVSLCLAEAFIDRGEVLAARHQLDAAQAGLRRWAPAPGLLRRAEAFEVRLRARSSVEPISRAELRVLELLPTHLTTAEIAERLHLSPNTVGSHIKALHRKLDAGRRSEVVEKAIIAGLLPTTGAVRLDPASSRPQTRQDQQRRPATCGGPPVDRRRSAHPDSAFIVGVAGARGDIAHVDPLPEAMQVASRLVRHAVARSTLPWRWSPRS